jgi:hypothetical protein
MTKRRLRLLAMVVLTIGLLSFAVDRIVPASRVANAASETNAAWSDAGSPETEAVPLTSLAQPVVIVVTGLVCLLFGVLAISPLLLDGSARPQ